MPCAATRPSVADGGEEAVERCEHLGHAGGRDRAVVLQLQHRLSGLDRRDDPADAQTGQPVRLRESARDDDALAASGEARALAALALGAAIDLVGEDPRAVSRGDAADLVDLTR